MWAYRRDPLLLIDPPRVNDSPEQFDEIKMVLETKKTEQLPPFICNAFVITEGHTNSLFVSDSLLYLYSFMVILNPFKLRITVMGIHLVVKKLYSSPATNQYIFKSIMMALCSTSI